MTDLQYTLATPGPARDVTAVMGRRTLAWVLDLVLYLAFAVAMFALLADYVDIPSGANVLDVCERLRFQDSDAAAGCVSVGDRAYITSNADNGLQSLAALGYFVFFVLLQGLVGGSPGKLLTGLRVVNDQGRRAGVGRSLLRTILWVVDGAPWFAPIVGFVTGLTTTGHRRVGDMAAKTYVVSRRDLGTPVSTGAPVMPPAQGAWGAPPPTWAPPTAPPATTPAPTTAPPPPMGATTPASSTPPPLPNDPSPTWAPPSDADTEIPDIAAPDQGLSSTVQPEAEQTIPEIDGRVDIGTPHVEPDADWWAGPEAEPSDSTPAADVAPEMPAWEDPTPAPDTTGDSWTPPTSPGDDVVEQEDPSPAAEPAPFTAPGAEAIPSAPPTQAPPTEAPPTQAPATPEPSPRPPPQWDQARNTYIQWEPATQQWLQWDEPAQRWKDIDS
ncbi:RDD family protein [Actinospongicola halichondriae]|uniref:RDD family protein n=1 Tax=Actinospongicola halichondriae TaxID=3236844 RepID=UPI003D55865C